MPAAIPIATLIVSAAGVGASIYQGNKQDAANRNSANQAKENAKKAQAQADIDTNRANQKQTDAKSILSQQQQDAAGSGSTMLTGVGGIDPNSLKLGKQTLLGA
jgi:phage protein|nr:MAG TPA: hypothetical protein [Caudoviricetes sp.]DAP70520.1 MAG TPA: hypothetical protein [Caudoviricetes sp.]DAS89391.1 MAG TPA: hypothetical protein [Caudoviricetes sp.]